MTYLVSGTLLLAAFLGMYAFIILNGGKIYSLKDKFFLFGIFCYLTLFDYLIFFHTKIYLILSAIVGICAMIAAAQDDKKNSHKFDLLLWLFMFLVMGVFAPLSLPIFGSIIYYRLDEKKQKK